MISFHGKESIKQEYLLRIRSHAASDQIIKGKYWQNGKGCAVGCTIHSSDHSRYETELGIPRILARLEDGIFESLPNELAMTWPDRFLDAIPVGKDLSLIWPKFAIWMLLDSEYGVIKFSKTGKSKQSIETIARLFQKKINGEIIEISTWKNAATDAADAATPDAAYSSAAAAYAAADAADAATPDAAYSSAAAAYAAAYAAPDAAAYAAAAAAAYAAAAADAAAAAYAAAAAAAYAAAAADAAAAREKWRIAQSEKILELFRALV